MVILDTNFICSLFNQSDPNHSLAKEIIFALDENEQIKVPFVVAAELSVNEDANKLLNPAKEISNKFIPNNIADLDYILSIPASARKGLKANDCLLLALGQRLNARLITFDKRLLKAYQKFVNFFGT